MSSFAEQQLEVLIDMISYKELYIMAYNKLYEGCNVDSAEQVYEEYIVPQLVEARIRAIRKELTNSLLNK